mgnify:CR=1 FL=1
MKTARRTEIRRENERVRELLERACAFYAAMLWKSDEAAEAREYLLGRGFPEDLLRTFRVGWAPRGGTALAGRAIQEGFSREQLDLLRVLYMTGDARRAVVRAA